MLRALIVGFTYQLGNLASAASSTIEATIGQRFPLPNGLNGEKRYDYGKVIGKHPKPLSVMLRVTFSLSVKESSLAPCGCISSSSYFGVQR